MGLELGVSICTNHSLRATAITRMFSSKVPERIIAEKSGYRSIAALHSYEYTSCEQEQVAGRAIVSDEKFSCHDQAASTDVKSSMTSERKLLTDAGLEEAEN